MEGGIFHEKVTEKINLMVMYSFIDGCIFLGGAFKHEGR